MKEQKRRKTEKKKQDWAGPTGTLGGCGTWSAPTRVVYSTSPPRRRTESRTDHFSRELGCLLVGFTHVA
jgi:hypothetical protein